MQDEWPLAYKGVSLKRHLVTTAFVACSIFSEDFRILEKRLELRDICLGDLLVASSLLHDIGKASHYFAMKSRVGKATFRFHELLSAHVILETLDKYAKQNKPSIVKPLELTAKIVSRHHAAMEGRHPSDLAECIRHQRIGRSPSQLIESNKALKEFDRHVIARILAETVAQLNEIESLNKSCEWSWIDLIRVIGEFLQSNNHIEEISWHTIEKLTSFIRDVDRLIVIVLSGMLIIADCLTASFCERRGSEGVPAYVEHWRRELASRLKKTQDLCEQCSSLCIIPF